MSSERQAPKAATTKSSHRRLLAALLNIWDKHAAGNFEGLFILVVLVSVAVIGYFFDEKLAFLNFFFIPVLLAGYFLSVRSAVLGSLLSILWVAFFVIVKPESFYGEPTPTGLFLHLLTWGSFLILCGVIVARLNAQVLDKFARLRFVLAEWKKTQTELDVTHKTLEDKNQTLEALRTKFESVLNSSMDAVTARLAVTDRLGNEKKDVAVLCAEFIGFASSADTIGPEAAVSQLNELLGQLEPILTVYHGHLDKFTGGGLMAEFGIPGGARQSALLAVLAALKMQQKAAARRAPWKMRVGISYGGALVGLIGSSSRKNYTALGPVVDLAAKLGDICPPGGICVDSHVLYRIGPAFHTRRLFTGRTPEDAESLEVQLRMMKDKIRVAPSFDLFMEAGRLCSELGESTQALAYYNEALSLDPGARPRIEDSVAEVRFQQEQNRRVSVKGEHHAAEVFEILRLRDPFEDSRRVPRQIQALVEPLFRAEKLNREMILPLEAMSGSLGHSQAAAALGYALADAMGLSDEMKRAAFLAGFFHDIGLRGLPAAVAEADERRPGLSPAEMELMRSHPLAASSALKDLGIELPAASLEAIEQHHENCDGSGYPAGRRGTDIALLARTVRIAEEYDALTSWRPHQDAMGPAEALAQMKLEAEMGGKLDPKILDVFCRLLAGPPGGEPR